MKYGEDSLGDPVEKAFETQAAETKLGLSAFVLGQNLGMNPNPQISHHQGDGDKHQPQTWVPRAGVDACLTQLAKARFDAKAFAVAFADLVRRTMHPPGGEEQLLLHASSVFAVLVGAIG